MAITIPILSEFSDKGIKAAESAFGKIGNVAKKAAIGIAAVGAAGVAVGAKLIAAGERAETANARISQIAESMGLFGEGTANAGTSVEQLTKRLASLAEKTALQTGVDQNQIKLTQAKLLTFKELATTADELGGAFDRATMAAVDMAAAGFGSAEMNAVQLGKALNDPIKGITALTRSGITFTESEKDLIKTLVESGKTLEAQDMILSAIETQVGGTAKATANASDRMKVAFSLLQERLGQYLLPIFEKFVSFIVDRAIPGIERVVEMFRSRGLSGIIQTIGDQIPGVLAKLQELGGRLLAWVGEQIPGWLEKLGELGQALIDWIEPRIGPMLQKLGEWISAAANWIIDEGLPMLVEKLVELGNALVDWIGPNIQPMLKKLGELLVALTQWIVTEAVPKVAAQALKLAGALLSWLAELLPKALAGLASFVVELVKALPGLFVDLVTTAAELGLQLGEAIWGALADAAESAFDKVLGFFKNVINDIIGGFESAINWIIDAINSAIRAYNKIPLAPDIGTIGRVTLPRMMAEGGIVTGPTLAMIGEAGPEAVIPLDRAGMMGNITVNVSGSVIAEDDLIETIRRGLVNAQRNGAQLIYSNVA